MKILKLNASNIESILEVERASFAHPWSYAMFFGEFQNPLFHCLGAAEEGRLAGFICYWMIAGEIHIGNIAVLPKLRRKGVAKTLLAALTYTARENSVRDITLEVRRGNEAAISLYTKAGFQPEGVRPRYYEDGEDAVIMWRRES